jgi:hypothetical protein
LRQRDQDGIVATQQNIDQDDLPDRDPVQFHQYVHASYLS